MGIDDAARAARVAEIQAKRATEARERDAVKRRIAEDAAERKARQARATAAAASPAPGAAAGQGAPGSDPTGATKLKLTLEDGRVVHGTFAAGDSLWTGARSRPRPPAPLPA